jgi:phage-related minor tail protein
MARLGDAVLHIGADLTDLNAKLGQAKKGVSQTMGNIQRMGAGLTASITAPIVALGASSFKTAQEFEASMAKVQAVSGATGAEFKALEQDALRLGSSTSFTASEVSGLQLEFAKLGFSSGEITKVTEATLNLAKASGSDLARSAEIAGATLRGFGLEADETSRVTDVMASSFSTTALDMESFGEAMKYVAPVAKSAGLSVEETTAMLGSLANAGVKGSQAGTALRRIISELGATGGDVSGAIKQLASEGLNLADAKDEVGRSAQSALLILSKSTDKTDELTEAYKNSQGSAKEMAGIMDNTSAGAMARMQSAIEGAQIAFGKVLAPVVEKVAKFIENLANKFTGLSDGTKKTIAIVAGVAAAIGPLLIIIPQLVSVASIAGPALATAFTVMTGPIGLAIGALGALVGAIFYFWDEVKQPLANAINMFINLYNENEGLRIAIAVLKQQFVATFTIAKRMVMNVVDSFTLLFKAIKTAITDGFGAGFDTLRKGMKQIAQDNVQAGKDVYQGFVDGVNEARTKDPVEFVTAEDLDKGMERLKGLFSFDMGGGGAGATSPMAQVTDDVKEMVQPMERATQAVGELDKSLQGVGQSVAMGVQPISMLRQEFVAVMDMSQDVAGAFVGIGQAIGDMISGAVTKTEILGKAVEGLGMFLKKMGSAMVAQAVAMLEFQKSLILNPGKAIAMGTAFVVAGALLANYGQQLSEGVALAQGGLAFGETMALVGDNQGAQFDPEVIAPLSKLKGMMGEFIEGAVSDDLGKINERLATMGTAPETTFKPDVMSSLMKLDKSMQSEAVQIYGRISGSDILLSNTRAERDRNRYA